MFVLDWGHVARDPSGPVKNVGPLCVMKCCQPSPFICSSKYVILGIFPKAAPPDRRTTFGFFVFLGNSFGRRRPPPFSRASETSLATPTPVRPRVLAHVLMSRRMTYAGGCSLGFWCLSLMASGFFFSNVLNVCVVPRMGSHPCCVQPNTITPRCAAHCWIAALKSTPLTTAAGTETPADFRHQTVPKARWPFCERYFLCFRLAGRP